MIQYSVKPNVFSEIISNGVRFNGIHFGTLCQAWLFAEGYYSGSEKMNTMSYSLLEVTPYQCNYFDGCNYHHTDAVVITTVYLSFCHSQCFLTRSSEAPSLAKATTL